MNNFVHLKNFLFAEVTSLGFAYGLIQKYASDSVKVFEATPTPRGAIVVLVSGSIVPLQLIEAEIRSVDEVENFWLRERLSEKVINAYLNQTLHSIKDNLVLIETDSICDALRAAELSVQCNLEICEFRIFRSTIHRCNLSLDTKQSLSEINKVFAPLTAAKKAKVYYIASPNSELRSQFHLEP